MCCLGHAVVEIEYTARLQSVSSPVSCSKHHIEKAFRSVLPRFVVVTCLLSGWNETIVERVLGLGPLQLVEPGQAIRRQF